MRFTLDHIIFSPDDVDLSKSPLKDLEEETYILGAFNPGMNILPNGNIIIMVRVAEALSKPNQDGFVKQIRWSAEGFVLDKFHEKEVAADDPRKFVLKQYKHSEVQVLTSFSWLLPVELSPDGKKVLSIHYDKIITATKSYQEYGIEDSRLALVEGIYYMTTCSVSSERHATTLHTSTDGLNYSLEGIILDHGNKDMLFFEGKIDGKYYALTRPMGSSYFPHPASTNYLPGPSINIASSFDTLHWKPTDYPFIRGRNGSMMNERVGGGTPPVLTSKGWLILYHGVEASGGVGIYRTFWAILDKDNPHQIIDGNNEEALLEANPELTEVFKQKVYINDVIFSTGIVQNKDHFIVASGELDLCCRITKVSKKEFGL